MKIGVYPGTFDPITNGHLDIIKRASRLFDKLYVVIPTNVNKNTLFSTAERISLVKEVTKDIDNVIVDSTNLLTVEYAKSVKAEAILRGLRMVSDFEYELQLAAINKSLDNNVETIFIMSSHEYSFLSSSSVKELAKFNGDVDKFVPRVVKESLMSKLHN